MPEQLNERERAALARETRMTRVSDLWLQSMPPHMIAEVLSMTRREVHECIRRLESEFVAQIRRERLLNMTAITNRELRRLAHMERRTWEAFDQSGRELKTTRTRQRNLKKLAPDDVGPPNGHTNGAVPPDGMPHIVQDPVAQNVESTSEETEAVVRVEEKNPDPRFLLVLTRIEQMRITLLGLDNQKPPGEGGSEDPIGVIEVYLDKRPEPAVDHGSTNGTTPETVIEGEVRELPPGPPADTQVLDLGDL